MKSITESFVILTQINHIMKKLLYSLLAICMASGTSFAQGNWCSSDKHYHQMLEKDPTLVHDVSRLFANGASKSDDTVVYYIPVVFHIVHEYGQEYITDAQARDAIDVLNRDYRLRNADTATVINEFKNVYAEARIEFRLAQIDPQGNCTNGINRVNSHETRNGDAFVKLSQWDRSKYLNVWVCGDMEGGTAGYALYPTNVNGANFWLDGIVIRHNYIGRTNTAEGWTGSDYNSRALTHEVGHWLGLPHVWGNTNDPNVACGDDGFQDTPETKGFTYCPSPANAQNCNPGVVENYQNYMDYSYCSYMFTHDQVAAMRFYATGEDGRRSNLITPENHEATGIFLTTNQCLPKVDISTDKKVTCVGSSVTFRDRSWNAEIISREWAFEDATPATSTSANPTVVFNTMGNKRVTLTVTTAAGTVTETFEEAISIIPDFAVNLGPYEYALNSIENVEQLRFINGNNTGAAFTYLPNGGRNNTGGVALINHRTISPTALPFSPEATYYSTLGAQEDEIIIPSTDLRTTTNATFSFDYAYATNTTDVAAMTEKIEIFYSRNCGQSWLSFGGQNGTITGAALVSGGFAGGDFFTPAANSWATYSRNITIQNADDRTMFKIKFTASDYSNNLYIDNIRVTGNLGIQDVAMNELELNVYPNPVSSSSAITIDYVAGNEPVTFNLRSLQGEEIMSVTRDEMNQAVSFQLELKDQLAASYYFLEVITSTGKTVKKIAVVK